MVDEAFNMEKYTDTIQNIIVQAIKDYSFNGKDDESLGFKGIPDSGNKRKLDYTLDRIGKIFELDCSHGDLSVTCAFNGDEVSDFIDVEYFANKKPNQPTDRMKKFIQDSVFRYLEKIDQLIFRLAFIADDIQELLDVREINKKSEVSEQVVEQPVQQISGPKDLDISKGTDEGDKAQKLPQAVTKVVETKTNDSKKQTGGTTKQNVGTTKQTNNGSQKGKSGTGKYLRRELRHIDDSIEPKNSENQIQLINGSGSFDQIKNKRQYKSLGLRYFNKAISFMPNMPQIENTVQFPRNHEVKNRRLIGANKVFEGGQLPDHVTEKPKKIVEQHNKFNPEFGKDSNQESLFFTTDLGFKEGAETDYIQVLVYKNKDMIYIVAESSYFKYSYEITALTKRLVLKKLDKILLDFRYLKYVLTNFLEKNTGTTELSERSFTLPNEGIETLREIAGEFGLNKPTLDPLTEAEIAPAVLFKISLENAKDGEETFGVEFGPTLPVLSNNKRLYFKIASDYCSFTYVKDYPTVSTFDTAFLPMIFYKTIVGILERQFRKVSSSFPEWYDIDFINPFVDMFEVLYNDQYDQISHLTGRQYRFPYKVTPEGNVFGHYKLDRMEITSMKFGGARYENTWDYKWENRVAAKTHSDLLLGFKKFQAKDARVQSVPITRERKVMII